MSSSGPSKILLWGIGLIFLGVAGIFLFRGTGRGPVPFAGWGGGGVYDKGTYATNGERIYYLGIDSDGNRLKFSGGPHWLRNMGGSCINCHGPDGRGGVPVMMGTHLPGDIRYSALISGAHHPGEEGEKPYTDEGIARAIRQGIEPSGQTLDRTMPRWRISDKDMNDLIEFLKTLK